MIGYLCEAGPDCGDEDGHALPASHCLDTGVVVRFLHRRRELPSNMAKDSPKPDDGKSTSRHNNKVAEVISKWHTSKNGKRHMQLEE